LILNYTQKNFGTWGIQWTHDESVLARLVTNEVLFYKTEDSKPLSLSASYKLQLEGITAFGLSRAKDPAVAVFLPEKNSSPASVRLFQYPNFASPVALKSFFKADHVQLMWNKQGSHLLALVSTEVDQTGKSYYGESNLYFLSARGGFDCHVTLDKDGPIQSVVWSPTGREFIVIYGCKKASFHLLSHACKVGLV
jgi:translation initiation factor 2A